jgi:hypothetical protein
LAGFGSSRSNGGPAGQAAVGVGTAGIPVPSGIRWLKVLLRFGGHRWWRRREFRQWFNICRSGAPRLITYPLCPSLGQVHEGKCLFWRALLASPGRLVMMFIRLPWLGQCGRAAAGCARAAAALLVLVLVLISTPCTALAMPNCGAQGAPPTV